jgi:hypothetical protein
MVFPSAADRSGLVTDRGFPWRPLGELLVEEGLISELQLELALAEQRERGGRLGEIIFRLSWIPEVPLMRVLAAQHGIDLSLEGAADATPAAAGAGAGANPAVGIAGATQREWRPLGRLLIEEGLIREAELEQALSEQRESGERLGRILVRHGAISVGALTHTLAEQHGVELTPARSLRTVLSEHADHTRPVDAAWFEIREARDGEWVSLHTSDSFLDATDLAFDVLYERDPAALQILHVDGSDPETVWTYRRQAA